MAHIKNEPLPRMEVESCLCPDCVEHRTDPIKWQTRLREHGLRPEHPDCGRVFGKILVPKGLFGNGRRCVSVDERGTPKDQKPRRQKNT